MKRQIITLALWGACLSGLAPAYGIPAFARRHKLSCTACHEPVPRLKEFGNEFAGNGFMIPKEEKAIDFVSAGDDLLWLNKTFPLAVRFDAFAVAEQDAAVDRDMQTPWGLKLLSGGSLYRNIGYYFYFYMSERGEVAGIEDAYIHFDNVFKSGADLLVGQFQACDPLMKRELRLTFEDYQAYKTKVGASNINLAYDRGITLVYGVEKTGTDVVAMLVNGNGKDPASGESPKFDSDSHKNIGLRVAQNVGGFASLGGFYYTGRENGSAAGPADESLPSGTNRVVYYGPDANLSYGPLSLAVQYLVRKDSDPWFRGASGEVRTKGTVFEATLAPHLDRSRFYWTFLYNRVESDLAEFEKYHTAALACTWLASRNLRLGLEAIRNLEKDHFTFVAGMTGAF